MRPEQPPGCTASEGGGRRDPPARAGCLHLAGGGVREADAVRGGRQCRTVVVRVGHGSDSTPDSGHESMRSSRASSDGLGEDRPLEHPEVQRLVRAVRARVGVLDARDEDLRVREHLDQVGDERDRAADPSLDRLPRPTPRALRAWPRRPPSPWCRRGTGSPRSMSLISRCAPNGACAREVRLERGVRVGGRLTGGDAALIRTVDRRDERVRRVGHGRRVDAGDRDRRLGPDAGQDAPWPIGGDALAAAPPPRASFPRSIPASRPRAT